jgi:hypothetical protein
LIQTIKDPAKVRAGHVGARQRWGEPRILRLDELTPTQRRVILALIGAMNAEPAEISRPAGPETIEGTSDASTV